MAIATPNLDGPAEPVTRRAREYTIPGELLVSSVRALIYEGNVRRLVIKQDDGAVLMEIPLSVSAVNAVPMAVWVALGAVASLAPLYRVTVEHRPRAGVDRPRGRPHLSYCHHDV